MSAITLILTDDGLAALTNPAHTGTSALTVTHVGLSQTPAGSIEAQKTLAVLPGEFKRLTTFGGEVISPRVIHLSVRDESADAYQLRSFALYLSNGVLAAVVSSADPIMEKVPATTMVQSLDLAFSRDIEAELVFGDFTFVNPPATTDRLGVVELATVEETLAGVDPARVVTVFGLGRTLLAWAQNFAARVHGHTIGEIDGLATALQGKAASNHQHAAADVTSGTFDIARIPAIAMGGITGLVDALNGKAASNHQHAASDITSGTFNIARIPAIAMSGITGLVDALASKAAATHQHIADDIVAGVLAVGRIPALGMEKITGLAVELASKASLAGAIFTGAVRVRSGTQGYVELNSGSAFRPGLIAFSTPDNTRRGYVGFASSDEGGELVLQGETGWTWRFSHRPKFGTATPWDTANFDPAGKVNKAGDVMTGPLTIPEIRLKATGTGSGGTYGALISKYYGDDNYGVGFVGWRGGIGWTEVGSIDHLGRFLVNGHRVWTAETLNPDLFARLNQSATFRDLKASRGDGTGVVMLGDDNHYLYYNGGAYVMPSGSLYVNDHPVWTTQTLAVATSALTAAGTSNGHFVTPAALWSFAKSIGASGYAQIPGTPLMLQWGSSNGIVNEGQIAAMLPIAFGGGCVFACAMPRNANSEGWTDYMMQVVGRYLDRVVFFAQRANAASGSMSGYEWLALGRVSGTPDPVYSAGGGTGGGGGGGELNPEV